MVTKHTSTNLEEINKKIARILQDPTQAIDHMSINVDEMTWSQLKEFADKGGLGACVSKVDVLASTPNELMYLQGERITILKHIENDIYMGYCEGVVGNFNAETVHFVELDPRVLESLDADTTSLGIEEQYRFTFRDSLLSFSSDPYSVSQQSIQSHYMMGQTNWAVTKRKSFESVVTNTSFLYPHPTEEITSDEDPYDTSAFNISYSDDEEPVPKKAPAPLSKSSKLPSMDEFGFIQTSPHKPSPPKSIKEYRSQELKWLSAISKHSPHTVKKDTKLKKLVRNGVPASVRARVWQFLAGSSDTLSAYLNKPPLPVYAVIEQDVAQCYPDHAQFMDPEGQGQKDMQIMLKAYVSAQQPYRRGIARLAGLILMQMPVEEAFGLLVATMTKYFTPNDAYIMGQLVRDHYPKLAQHLESHGVVPDMYVTEWFMTGFTTLLSWDAVLRVWDAFYFEGVQVFYRVGLAILDVYKDQLLECNSDLLQFLLHIPIHQSNHLLDIAFKINLNSGSLLKKISLK